MSRFEDDDADRTGGPPMHPGVGIDQADPAVDRDGMESGAPGLADVDDVVDAQPAATPSPKKRSIVPIAAFGVVFLGVLGAVGYSMLGMLAGKAPAALPQEAYSAAPPVVEPPAAQPAVAAVVTASPASAVDASPAQATQPVVVQIPPEAHASAQPSASQTVQPQVAQQVSQQTATAPAATPAVTSAIDTQVAQGLQASIDRIDARIEQLSREVAQLREQRTRVAAAPAAQVVAAPASSKPRRAAARSASPAEASASTAVATPQSKSSDTIASMSLRAVFPPTGADMQAWVMDGETLRVVSKGSSIGDGRVLEVRPDRVVTDRGVIR
jgi:hypothetical protein